MYNKIIIILILFSSFQLLGQEKILKYKSEISINADASLDIIETIKVRTEGDQIQHGIYRIFPIKYKDHYGNDFMLGFEIIAIQRDRQSEPYRTENGADEVTIYMGDEDYSLPPGIYEYEIHYRLLRQVGYFDDFDELYWNVTSNNWNFPIDTVMATVHLPPESNMLEAVAYSGYYGESGKDFTIEKNTRQIDFTSSRPYEKGEGLTIAVSWPKGYVSEPTAEQKMNYFYRDNTPVIWGVCSVILVFLWWIWTWKKVGVDPKKGKITPQDRPPANLSPSDSRYVYTMKYDDKALSADLIQMAVKKHLIIEKNEKDNFVIKKTDQPPTTERGKGVWEKLFPTKYDKELTLNFGFDSKMGELSIAHKAWVLDDLKNVYFKLNFNKIVIGHFLSFASMIIMFSLGSYDLFIILGIFCLIWTLPVSIMLYTGLNKLKEHRKLGTKLKEVWLFFIGSILLLSLAFTALWFALEVGPIILLVISTHIALNLFFSDIIKAPTIEGRKVIDQLEGFRLYLIEAQKNKFEGLANKEEALKHFESYLPYAMALEVELSWSNTFTGWLSQASQSPYDPSWYYEKNRRRKEDFSDFNFAGNIGTGFSSSISRTSTAPSSSSGSSGGGSSGGGGGGGGGGGW